LVDLKSPNLEVTKLRKHYYSYPNFAIDNTSAMGIQSPRLLFKDWKAVFAVDKDFPVGLADIP
jgi:hypothetical protein